MAARRAALPGRLFVSLTGISEQAGGESMEVFARWIMGLDRFIHAPSRLAVLTILRESETDYLHLKRLTGLSKGNLSNHLAKLEDAGLLTVGKHFESKTPVTTPRLTEQGRQAIDSYWSQMGQIATGEGGPRN